MRKDTSEARDCRWQICSNYLVKGPVGQGGGWTFSFRYEVSLFLNTKANYTNVIYIHMHKGKPVLH